MIRARFDVRDLGGRPRWRIAGFAFRVSFVFLLLARYFMMSVSSKFSACSHDGGPNS